MHNLTINVISLFILGATTLAFIYHAVLYVFNKDKFLIHYLIYLFFTGVFLFSKTGIITAYFGSTAYAYLMYYFLETIQIIYLTSYFNFIIEAIEISKIKDFILFRYWKYIMSILIAYALLHALAKFFLMKIIRSHL